MDQIFTSFPQANNWKEIKKMPLQFANAPLRKKKTNRLTLIHRRGMLPQPNPAPTKDQRRRKIVNNSDGPETLDNYPESTKANQQSPDRTKDSFTPSEEAAPRPALHFRKKNPGVSWHHEGNMGHLLIPKLKACQTFMKPLSKLRSQCRFCSQNLIEV